MEKMTIGQYIALRRKSLGLRQTDLGEKLSYSVQAISKIEKGQSEPAGATLPSLANALKVSLEDLFALNENPENNLNKCPPFDNVTFSQNFAYLRLKENLSQKDLARILGISKRSVANYEQGTGVPSYESIKKLLAHFSLNASQLYFQTLSPTQVNKQKLIRRSIWAVLGSFVLAGVAITVSLFRMRATNNVTRVNQVTPPESTSESTSESVSSDSSSIETSPYLLN